MASLDVSGDARAFEWSGTDEGEGIGGASCVARTALQRCNVGSGGEKRTEKPSFYAFISISLHTLPQGVVIIAFYGNFD